MGLFTILFVLFAWTAVGGTVVTSVSELTRVSAFADREPCAFSLTGRVHAVFSGTSPSSSFVIDDGTGRMPLYASAQTAPVALGDHIVASGKKAVLGWSTDLYDDILTPELDVTVLAHVSRQNIPVPVVGEQ
ncbi:MAG TPA: OB-fold nucleic acid binding domain-containing protein, partial [Kiritimatiellia bacterium]|nr:OB-fold nucleic acid binding domain-containing protein [Kiritimatiellia bacterium]